MAKEIDIGIEFSDYLVNRNKLQGDGTFTAEDFRSQFLKELDNETWWEDPNSSIVLNFKNVRTLGPSWANETFAYYTNKKSPEQIYKKIILKDISTVKREIIEQEVESGYAKKIS